MDIVRDGLLIGIWLFGAVAVIACLFHFLGKWVGKSDFLSNLFDALSEKYNLLVKKIFKKSH